MKNRLAMRLGRTGASSLVFATTGSGASGHGQIEEDARDTSRKERPDAIANPYDRRVGIEVLGYAAENTSYRSVGSATV